jgi:N-methylhydantoinase A
LGIDVHEAARSIRQVVDETMGSEIFKEVALKGYDPREFAVFSFGGGGPLHACGYADVLQIDKVVVPPHSSVFSASGAAGLELLHIYEQSAWMVLFNPLTKRLFNDYDRFNAIVDGFRAQAFADFGDEGFAPDGVRMSVELDVRSTGQIYVITIASPVDRIENDNDLAAVIQAYFEEYRDRFGDLALTREIGVSLDAIRLRAWIPRAPRRIPARERVDRGVDAALRGTRSCWWSGGGFEETPIYDYGMLAPGYQLSGPAVIEAADTTILVEPAWVGRMDEYGFFTLQKEESR